MRGRESEESVKEEKEKREGAKGRNEEENGK